MKKKIKPGFSPKPKKKPRDIVVPSSPSSSPVPQPRGDNSK